MADRYWITTSGTTNNWGNTNNWSTTSGGSGPASVPTASDNAIFDQAGTYTAVISDARNVNNLTISAGTVTINLSTATTSTFTIGGNVDFTGSASGTNITGLASATGIIFATTTGTNTVNLQGRNIANTPIQIGTTSTTTGSLQLTGTFSSSTTTAKITHLKGNLDLNNNVLYCFWFTSTANSRNIDFGTSGYIQVNGSSFPQINITVTGLPTATGNALFVINCGASAAQAIIYFRASIAFATQSGGLDFLPNATNGVTNLDFTNFAGTWAARSSAYTIYGNLTLSTGMTSAASTGVMTFGATSGTQIITSNGKALNQPININGVGGTVKLADALNMGSTALTLTNGTFDGNNKTITGTSSFTMVTGSVTMQKVSTAVAFTHTSGTLTQGGANTLGAYTQSTGTLDLYGFALTCTTFTSNNANTRTISFTNNINGNGIINLSGTGTVWTTATVTGLTVNTFGNSNHVIVTSTGSVAITVASGALTESNGIVFAFTGGTYALTFLGTAGYSCKGVDFTGFSGTWGAIATCVVYDYINLSSTMTITASVNTLTISGTSISYIASSGKTIPFPVTINSTTTTCQLFGDLTIDSTKTLSLLTGTFDLNGYNATCGLFSSSNTNTRAIAFGTKSITCNGAGGTLWNTATNTGFTTTGTQVVNISYAGSVATTIQPGPLSEANSIAFNFTAGSYTLTSLANSQYFRSMNFQGFTGSAPTVGTLTSSGRIYKDLNLGTTISSFGTTGTTVYFAGTTTQTVTSNGKTFNSKIIINNVGGGVVLADALTQASTVDFALQSGDLNLNGQTLTVGAVLNGFATYLTGTKSITFNGGILVCPFSGVAFNNPSPTGFTTVAGTGTGKISFTGVGKTFTAGGSTYNCTISNDGAGVLTISGNNTFDTITSTTASGNITISGSNTITTITTAVRPVTFTFASSTTQTITNWNLSGTAGNLVTIVSSVAGTAATLSKSGGTVSADYLSLKDSAATGGASWYAGTNSTNVSGNSGWIFTGPPAGNTGAFFFMF